MLACDRTSTAQSRVRPPHRDHILHWIQQQLDETGRSEQMLMSLNDGNYDTLPITDLLGWLWQRWELEVAHRQVKSGLSPGEKQCWNSQTTVAPVQWSVWIYALMIYAGNHHWGNDPGPKPPGRWRSTTQRWSFAVDVHNTLDDPRAKRHSWCAVWQRGHSCPACMRVSTLALPILSPPARRRWDGVRTGHECPRCQ
jgi:hypothetical protein